MLFAKILEPGTMQVDDSSQASSVSSKQYSLTSMLWMTTAAALLLGYARNMGAKSLQLLIAYAIFWIVWALVFSLISRNWKETVFWSGLIVTQAFLAISAVRLLGESQAYGWGMVGATCGAFCGARLIKQDWLASLLCSALGALSILLVLAYFKQPLTLEITFDLIGAAAVGFVLWYFVNFLRWFEQRSRQPRAVLVAWLTISVLVGNALVSASGY